jgi:hypothetical protein
MLACSLNPNSKNEPRVARVAIIQEILIYQVVFEKKTLRTWHVSDKTRVAKANATVPYSVNRKLRTLNDGIMQKLPDFVVGAGVVRVV